MRVCRGCVCVVYTTSFYVHNTGVQRANTLLRCVSANTFHGIPLNVVFAVVCVSYVYVTTHALYAVYGGMQYIHQHTVQRDAH